MAYTTDDFLQMLKQEAMIPAKQSLYDDSMFLKVADLVIRGYMVPLLRRTREEFFIVTEYKQFTADEDEYDIPYRAIGRATRDVKLVKYESGVPDESQGLSDLALIAFEEAHLFRTGDVPEGHYFKADKIIVCPAPSSTSYGLRIDYPLRPSKLCLLSAAAVVQSITDDDVTVVSYPSSWTTATVLDMVQAKQGHTLLAKDLAITGINGNIISFATGIVPDGLTAGDYLTVAETSPVIMLPEDAYPLLITKTAQRIMGNMVDSEAKARLTEDEKQQATDFVALVEPRNEGEPKKIVNRNGLLRGRLNRYRFLYRE